MAQHKIIWCSLVLTLTIVSAAPKQSSPQSEEDRTPSDSPGFRFGEEYFTAEGTDRAGEDHKADGCEKVVKDSMVCMVCQDPHTDAKYEQCSYVPQQSARSFSYGGSSVPKPSAKLEDLSHLNKESSQEESGESEEADGSAYSGYYGSSQESEEAPAERLSKDSSRRYNDDPEYLSESERLADRADKSKCTEEKRDDGMTCQVCTDPGTGGNFEKCAYRYEPSDKAYKFSRSSSFGTPRREESKGKAPKKAIRRVDGREVQERNLGEGKSSQKVDQKCREVRKDSMTCVVCTDPKTRRNSEKCSYSYDPADKLYTYSQSRSFGSKGPSQRGSKVEKE